MAKGRRRRAFHQARQVRSAAPQPLAAITSKLQRALEHHQRGELARAEALYQNILAQVPAHFDALHLLGVARHQRGHYQSAVELIGRALTIDPGNAAAHLNIGSAFRALKRPTEALASFERAASLKPDYADAFNNRGVVLLDLKRPEEALASFDRALALRPDYVEALNNRGIALRELNRPAEACASAERALALKPDYADALTNRGNVLRALKQPEEALASFDRALAVNPDYTEALNGRGAVLLDLKRPEEALASFDQALMLRPDYAEALYNRGNALRELGRHGDALANYDRALALKPDYADALNNRGSMLVYQGRQDEAAASFRKALSIKPDLVEAHASLSLATKHAWHDDDIRSMERLIAREDLSAVQKMHLCFALGKALEDIKEYPKAFDYILEGNRLLRASYAYSISEDEHRFERIKQVFNADFISARNNAGSPDDSPIFIVGMPRSGTSLVEQILASHPDVVGAGELNDLPEVVESHCGQRVAAAFPECVLNFEAGAFAQLGSDYVQRIRQHSSAARRITDKRPHNFLMIGLIKTILPNARIVHCVRDPMDSCWSLFKLYATGNFRFAHDFCELGRYYNLYLDLMAHWHAVLPDFVFDVKYEELVSDQRTQTKRLLDYCGLPWDEACLSFYKTERTVATPSATQVRRPIYKDSVQLWKNYEPQLEPLRKALSANAMR